MTFEPKIRWALVGLGDIVRKRVGPALLQQPHSILQACVTRDPAARADELALLRPQKVYTDFEQMLSDSQIDAVYLATPVFLHAVHAIAALRAGKHVLVEKPMALNTHEAEEMLTAARRADRWLAVAYFRRFWPTFQQVDDLLKREELGEIVVVRMALHSWYVPSADDPKAWRVRPEQSGGGVMSDVGSHRLDLLAWWFGLPRRVVANVRTQSHSYAVEDSVDALLTFAREVPCTVSFHWNSRSWGDELHIVGTEGKVSFLELDSDEMTITRGRETTSPRFSRPANAHYPLIDDFARSIVEDRPPRFIGVDSIAASRMMDWINQSAQERAWVETN